MSLTMILLAVMLTGAGLCVCYMLLPVCPKCGNELTFDDKCQMKFMHRMNWWCGRCGAWYEKPRNKYYIKD